MLSIFPCAHWLLVYLLSRILCPLLNMCFFVAELKEFFLYIPDQKSLMGYMLCKYFLLLGRPSF